MPGVRVVLLFFWHVRGRRESLTSVFTARSLPAAQRALHEWHHDGHELCLGDLWVATCWALHARVCPLAPVAFMFAVRMPAVVMKVMLALGDMPPDGILADRLQADRTGLLFLRGCAKLLPHAAKIGLLSLRNGSLRETRM